MSKEDDEWKERFWNLIIFKVPCTNEEVEGVGAFFFVLLLIGAFIYGVMKIAGKV